MFKVRLKELLARKEMTFKFLSEKTGINYRWLSEFSNNRISLFQNEKIAKLCLALDCTLNDLFELIDIEDTEKKTLTSLIAS